MDRYSLLDSPDGAESACMSGIFIDIQPMDVFTDRQRKRRKLLYALKGDYGGHDPARSIPRRAKRGLLGLFRAGCRGLGLDRAIFSVLARGEGRWIAYDLSFQRWWPGFHAPEVVFPLKRHAFEGFEFPVPADTDAYLRTQFGNYMELPPKELRRPVHAGGIHLTGPNPHREGLPWPGRL
jgi:lipopolysaccharide cholinephosphotransferase